MPSLSFVVAAGALDALLASIRLSKPKGEGGRALRIKRQEKEGSRELIYSV